MPESHLFGNNGNYQVVESQNPLLGISEDNPIYGQSVYGNMNWLQRFGYMLGNRSGYQNTLNSMLAEAKAYDNQRKWALEDREYNSEAAQLERQRAIGLNPDLLGSVNSTESDTASATAAGMPGLQAQLQAQRDQALNMVSSISSGLLAAGEAAFGIYTGMLQLDAGMLESVGGFAGLARNIAGQLGDLTSDNPASVEGFDVSEYLPKFHSKRYRGMISDALTNFLNSDEAKAWIANQRASKETARQGADQATAAGDAVRLLGASRVSGTENPMLDGFRTLANLQMSINTSAMELQSKLNKLRNTSDYTSNVVGAENAQNVYTRSYYGNRNGANQAAAENAADQFRKQCQEAISGQVSKLLSKDDIFSVSLGMMLANSLQSMTVGSVVGGAANLAGGALGMPGKFLGAARSMESLNNMF